MYSAEESAYVGEDSAVEVEEDTCECEPEPEPRQLGPDYDSGDEGLPDGETFARYCRATGEEVGYHARAMSDESNPHRSRTLRRTVGAGRRGDDLMSCQESLVTQFLCHDLFPRSTRCCSDFTAGPGQQAFGLGYRQRADCLLSDPAEGGGMTLRYFNFHGAHFHAAGDDGAPEHRPGCRLAADGGQADYRGADDDELKRGLAAALTAAAAEIGVPLSWRYEVLHECQVFHSLASFDPASVGSAEPARKKDVFRRQTDAEEAEFGLGGHVREEGDAPYTNLRQLLHQRHHEASVLGVSNRVWSQEALVAKILKGKTCAEGNSFGGFVEVQGGYTTADLGGDDATGYCLQRCPTELSELGDFTRLQALAMCDGDEAEAELLLDKYCRNDQTALRQSFKSPAETMSLDLFRFLSGLGFRGYRILHFCFFRQGLFLNGWLDQLQQRRHDLKRAGSNVMMQHAIKLTMNATYG
jgi:hypothetical protein